jgi:hypothetical protein
MFALLEFRDANLPGYEPGNRGLELSRVSELANCQSNGKKGIRLCKEGFMRAAVTVRLL